MRRALIFVLCLASALATGCIKAKDTSPSATRRPSLGKQATVIAPPAGSSAARSPGGTSSNGGAAGSAASSPSSGSAATTTIPSSGAGLVADAADGPGDQGADGPGYADLRRVTIETVGTSARVTVTVGAALPVRLASGEVMGIGVDLYRPNQAESDYQLFADGESTGWAAYLQTPAGFVAYPGSFTVSGDSLVFTVAWSALGDPRPAEMTAFADWSRKAVVTTVASRDVAPDTGRTALRR